MPAPPEGVAVSVSVPLLHTTAGKADSVTDGWAFTVTVVVAAALQPATV